MKRRTLISSLGAIAASTVGCLGESDASTGGEPFSEIPCPPFPTSGDRSTCSHVADDRRYSVYVFPEPEESTLEAFGDEIEVMLHNDSERDIEFNPHSWTIHRRGNGEWTELEPTVVGDGKTIVESGGTRAWTLSEIIERIEPDTDFRAGTYAASITIGSTDTTCIGLFRLHSA